MIGSLKFLPLYFSSPNHCSTAETPQTDKSDVTDTVLSKTSAQDIAFIAFNDTFVEILHTQFKRVFNICLKWAPLRYEYM